MLLCCKAKALTKGMIFHRHRHCPRSVRRSHTQQTTGVCDVLVCMLSSEHQRPSESHELSGSVWCDYAPTQCRQTKCQTSHGLLAYAFHLGSCSFPSLMFALVGSSTSPRAPQPSLVCTPNPLLITFPLLTSVDSQFEKYPVDMRIPPLTSNIMLESKPLRSRILVRRLPAAQALAKCSGVNAVIYRPSEAAPRA